MNPTPWIRAAALALAWLTMAGTPAAMAAPATDPARPLWLRQPAVSPDGQRIAFVYGGQIWLVPAQGGEAVALTSATYYSNHPVWSPDGQRIAFAADRHGNPDVYVMPAEGGPVTRLTQHSAADVPQAFSRDGSELLFSSARLGSPKADALDAVRGLAPILPQLYAVPVGGGRSRMVLPTPAVDVQPSPDGSRLLYTDMRSIENEWRKHHVSDATRDIWLYDTRKGTHQRLTDFRGEDRNAVWSPQGDAMLWLSERSGSFNVWRQPIGGGAAKQVTQHSGGPVRFLSAARDGALVYGFDGEIWRLAAGATQPQRVAVHIRQADMVEGRFNVRLDEQATELAVSPSGTEFAIVARGDVFVVSALSGATRRITSTGAEERGVSFSSDGRRLLYASERSGSWDVMEARLTRATDLTFSGATPFDEVVLIGGPADNFQPRYSPDGTRVAYRADRNTLRVFDIAKGTSVEVLARDAVYSYVDGDLNYAWAPNGRWLVTRTGFEIGNAEVELIDAAGVAPRVNISRSGFADQMPQVSADGNAVLWLSDRAALRTADQSAAALDVMAAFLTPEAFEAFRASPDERLRQAIQAATQSGAKAATPAPVATADPGTPKLDGIQRRTVRLTPFSVMPQFFRLTPDGRTLVVVTSDPTGASVAYAIDLPSRRARVLFQRAPRGEVAYETDAGVTKLFSLGAGGIDFVDLASGQAGTIPFAAEVARDAQAEIAGIFDHAWRLSKVKFYDAKLHGVDWDAVGASYRKFLPHIRHWEDLAEVLSEMAGELNASHQGASYHADGSSGDTTAALGVYYDDAHRGAGLRVAEVLAGGPADRSGSAIRLGALIVAVDGQTIGPADDIDRLLNRKVGQPVRVSVAPAGGGAVVDEVITPMHWALESSLAYQRWVDKRREMVRQMSGGRLGYLHVPGMDLHGFLGAYGELFGQHRLAEAVVVDVRFNGGGNLHDQLVAMLTGQHTANMVTRDGVKLGQIPNNRWAKPSVVIANAGSYSDGSVFPSLYQREKIGALVGDRVPGTGTAVIWEPQIERKLTYGVPQLGFQATDGRWFENQEIVPELPVENDPNSVAAGRDLQLEKAVAHLLSQLGAAKPTR